MATASQRSGTAKSQMDESRREKLLDIQKREQLKGMLVNKFRLKYGKNQGISNYIDNEVTKFLKNDRLSEDNLKKLDQKILKETELREKQGGIIEDRKSERSAGGRALSQRPGTTGSRKGDQFDAKSVASSRMSGASKLSRAQSKGKDEQQLKKREFDGMSLTSSQGRMTEVYSELDEDDEWTAIQKFNTLLHYEEQKQSIMRDKERKRLIKLELDKQLQEKRQRKNGEVKENRMYESL